MEGLSFKMEIDSWTEIISKNFEIAFVSSRQGEYSKKYTGQSCSAYRATGLDTLAHAWAGMGWARPVPFYMIPVHLEIKKVSSNPFCRL